MVWLTTSLVAISRLDKDSPFTLEKWPDMVAKSIACTFYIFFELFGIGVSLDFVFFLFCLILCFLTTQFRANITFRLYNGFVFVCRWCVTLASSIWCIIYVYIFVVDISIYTCSNPSIKTIVIQFWWKVSCVYLYIVYPNSQYDPCK